MSVVRRYAIFLVAMLVAAPFTAPLEPASASVGVRTVEAPPLSSEVRTSDPLDDVVPVPGVTIPEWPTAERGPSARVAAVVHTVWVSVVNATPTTTDNGVTGLDDQANIRALIAKMNAFWTQESGGRVSVVFGGYEKRELKASCDLNDIYYRAAGSAFGGKFAQYAWVGTNEHLLVLPRDGCSSGSIGLGSLGGYGGQIVSLTGSTGPLALSTALHEFGHNLGFGHAGAAICLKTDSADAVLSSFSNGSCPVQAYGDTLDIMGRGRSNAIPHLSSPQRISAGYLTDVRELRSASGVTTATILPLDSKGTSGVRAVRIVDPLTQEVYVVEYRTSAGSDATSAEFAWSPQRLGPFNGGYYSYSSDMSAVTGGVRVLRQLSYNSYAQTAVLATGLIPGSLDRKSRDTHLDAGEAFSSVNRGFTLSVKSLNASTGAVITVSFGAAQTASAVATSTTLAADPGPGWWTQTAGSSATVQVRATVASANGKVPSGKVTFLAGTRLLATVAADARGVAVLKLPSTLAAGTYTVAAQFVPTSTSLAPSRSEEEALTVVPGPAASTTTLSVNRASQVYGSATRVSATATVAKVAGVYPAGSVVFSANGTALGTVKLGAGGTAVYPLSPTLSVGARALTARFVPATAAVRTSTSPAVTVTVAKATSKTVVALVAPSVKTTKSAVVKVIVTVPGVARPTGTLTAYADGKVLKTYPMAAVSAGKMSLTLPTLSVAGVKTITVRYGGDSNIAAATSAGARLTVTK